jgi:hypothetical protein
MNRDDVLAFACGSLCIQIDGVLSAATQGVSVSMTEPIQPDDVVTWLAKGARFLTLIQTNQGTRVYDHADDLLYYAGPQVQLPKKECPESHAFLCQAVWDHKRVPRLLLTDLVLPAISCPRARGDILRRLAPSLPPAIVLQWAGDKTALQAFIDSGSVPHEVESLVALRRPLQLARGSSSGIAALDALSQLL